MGEQQPESSAARRSVTWAWVAAAVVLAIAVAGVVVAWRIATRPDTSWSEVTPTATAPAPEGSCPEGPVEMSGTVTTGPDANWVLVGKMAAPTVEDAGPAVEDEDGYRHCYARTPLGALVAAANLAAMGSEPSLAGRLTSDALVPGALRDRLLASPQPSSSSSGSGQLRGFRMVSYDGTKAVVELGMQTANGRYGSVMVELVWYDGDWRYGVRGEGAAQDLAVTYSWPPSLVGFIVWSGV